MKKFNLKSYHIRGINASTEAEKLAVNQELKYLYESLSEEDKKDFNEQLHPLRVSVFTGLWGNENNQTKNQRKSV